MEGRVGGFLLFLVLKCYTLNSAALLSDLTNDPRNLNAPLIADSYLFYSLIRNSTMMNVQVEYLHSLDSLAKFMENFEIFSIITLNIWLIR